MLQSHMFLLPNSAEEKEAQKKLEEFKQEILNLH